MQRGTSERIFWPIDPRKRPDARHFVWLVLVHPPCHLAFIENKSVNVVLARRWWVGIPSSGKNGCAIHFGVRQGIYRKRRREGFSLRGSLRVAMGDEGKSYRVERREESGQSKLPLR